MIEVTVEDAIERKGIATVDHIGHLSTRDEVYGTMDKVMGELKAIVEEQAVQSQLLSGHGDRIDRIESRPGISSD